MPKIPTNSWRVRECLLDREPFETRGSLRATSDVRDAHPGRLPTEWASRYETAALRGRVRYVVVSYSTPIAWVLTDGTVVQPPVKYSRTTTRHQSLLYALGDLTFSQKVDIRDAAQRERAAARQRRHTAEVRRLRREHGADPDGYTPPPLPTYPPVGSIPTGPMAQNVGPALRLFAPPAPAVPVEDPTATLEDRIAALEAETFAQLASTQTVLRQSAQALRDQATVDRRATSGAYRLEDIYGEN